MEGVIKNLNDRGFGFIKVQGQEKDIFFHAKSLRGVHFDELKAGDPVTFETKVAEKGLCAVDIYRA